MKITDSLNDDELDGVKFEMQENEEEWKVIADLFSLRRQLAQPYFTGLIPALRETLHASFSDVSKLFYVDKSFGKIYAAPLIFCVLF